MFLLGHCIFLLLLFLAVGAIHSEEDTCASDGGHDGHGLVEHKRAGYGCADGVEIDVVARLECAQLFAGQTPQGEAAEAGYDAKKDQVSCYDRFSQIFQWECPRMEKVDGQHSDNAVEEHLARNKRGAVMRYITQENAVDGPT